MRYKTIVVDDEPVALAHICSIIEKKCPEYQVIATACNGREGLEKVLELHPDILISDVAMPLLNGIGLISEVKKQCPEVCCLIVSGYSDFEYAKEALQLGVYDYILKPVVPSEMKKTLDKTAQKIKAFHFKQTQNIIQGLCSGTKRSVEELKRYFPYEKYYCAIVRRNGLPRRFSQNGNSELYSDITDFMAVCGRDEMEALYIIPEELLLGMSFEQYLEKIIRKLDAEKEYVTTVYDKKSFGVENLQERVCRLYQALDAMCVVGVSQTLEISRCGEIISAQKKDESVGVILESLEYMLKSQQYDKVKKKLRQVYKDWCEAKKTQLWMEDISRQFHYMVQKYIKSDLPVQECEYMLEDLFFYAVSSDELVDGLMDIWFRDVKKREESIKLDSPDFFESVEKYIQNHLAESMSLQTVCKHFSVSQTYMGKLFRKYKNQSFCCYLTTARMERAVMLMKENPDIFIKDLAIQVGYNDQFYFSRIFRTYMGVSPSDYLEALS